MGTEPRASCMLNQFSPTWHATLPVNFILEHVPF